MASRLIGHWELVSYDSIEPDGSVRQPFGTAVGRLSYDERGNMTGQVMRSGRPPVEAREGAVARHVLTWRRL